MEHAVFISHAHKDEGVADAICEKLESAGVKCWIAGRDISADKDWSDTTRNAIGSSRVVVLVLSENANAAPHIKREIAHAFYTRRVIISFRLGDTFPRREFLFYLGKAPALDSARPPTEQDLKALAARIQGLLTPDAVSADPVPLETARQTKGTTSFPNSWLGGLQASHYRTLGVLKWAAMATALFAVVWFLWFTLWQTKERTSLAENEYPSIDHRSKVPPEPSPRPGADAGTSNPTDNFTRFGLWQGSDSGPKPTAQDTPIRAPAEQSVSVTPTPRSDVPSEESAALASASAPHSHSLPPSAVHRAPHYHHPPSQGTKSQEPDKTSDRAMSPRDALQSRLKATEAEVQTAQKNADLVAIQLETLHNELKESKAETQTAENSVEALTKERDGLRNLLEKTEAQAQVAQTDGDLARSQRDSLQAQLKEAEAKIEMIQKNADLAASQRDALQTELDETKKRAELAETQANLAVSQRIAMEAELKKAQEEAQLAHENADLAVSQRNALEEQMRKIQEAVSPLARHDTNLTGSNDSKLKSASQEEPGDAQPQEEADSATDRPGPGQMQPPNPGHNAKLPPLTQALNSSIQSTSP
jgi:hypothetical protein